ncbi:MAG: cardiolipin synthase [Clostridia bacterium]|nr:cardiolipin synthase [Clostridia bacterium]
MSDIPLIYIINIILTIVIVFYLRREPAVSIAWVMFFILFPNIAPIFFIIFGLGVKSYTKHIYKGKMLSDSEIANALFSQTAFLNMPETRDIESLDLVRYFNNYNSLLTDNNDAEIICDAWEKYEKLLYDIENAKESINMLYFIFRKDRIGERIMNALVKKANEGVTVRFLYDSFGCLLTPKSFLTALNNTKSGRAVSFYPVNIFSLTKINHRNHRKIVVIDNEIAYLGGMNVGNEYMGISKTGKWRDTHLRITGDAVQLIYSFFCFDWDFSAKDNITKELEDIKFSNKDGVKYESLPMQIVSSGPDSPQEEIKCGIIKMLFSARKYAYIQSPYFIPDAAFRNAMVTAAESGVDVRLMIPGVPDKKYVYYSSFSYLEEMLRAGVKVYLYNGFIHSKTCVIDDKISTIGTTNIDIRSFQLHFELNAFFYQEKFAKKCKQIFEEDIFESKHLTLDEYKDRSFFFKVKEGFFRLFSAIM